MGGSHSSPSRRRISTQQDFTNFINQKEYVFIAMQSDIDRAFAQKHRKQIEDLAGEIVAHIMDLKQIPQENLNQQELDRVRKLIYSFEISFAKLKSVYNCDTSFLKKKRELPPQENLTSSHFYSDPVEPDIVSDINKTEAEEQIAQRRKAPPIPTTKKPEIVFQSGSSIVRQSLPNSRDDLVTRSLPLNRKSLPNNEFKPTLQKQFSNYENSGMSTIEPQCREILFEIKNTFQSFVLRASKPVKDIDEYYQMDKTVFFMYTQLSKLIISDDEMELNTQKTNLLKDLVDFRGLLGKKAGEFKEVEDAIGVLDESIYANDTQPLEPDTFKIDPNAPTTDLDDLPNPENNNNGNLISFEPSQADIEIVKIESMFESIKSKAFKPVQDVSDYYVIDVALTDLYTNLKEVEIIQNDELETTKLKLLDNIAHFKELMDKKVCQFEELKRIEEDLNTLSIVLDSSPPNELRNLSEKLHEVQQRIEHTNYDKHFLHKQELFREKLRILIDQISLVESQAVVDESFEPIYGNLGKPSMENFEILGRESINPEETDHVENEQVYLNFEEIRQGITHQDIAGIVSTNDQDYDASSRDSLYSNIDVVKQHLGGSVQKLVENYEEHAKKPPRPLPRNYEEKLINGLPKQWKRLNEIYESENLSPKDLQEVEEIRRQLEMTKNLFQRKIEKIYENFEGSVDL